MANSLQDTASWLHLFGDPTRVRLMALLGQGELTVGELQRIMELPQSRVSTHLGKLRDAGLLDERRHGTSIFYRAADRNLPKPAAALWEVILGQTEDPLLETDGERAAALIRARDEGASWPDAMAGQMERHYSPGRTWQSLAHALVTLIRLGRVLDVGSGDGTLAAFLAPRSQSYTCVDRSAPVLEAARRRLAGEPRASVVEADMHELPFEDGSFDTVLLLHALAHARSPARALAEAARVLAPGGGLTVVTLAEHRHMDMAGAYGHVQPGFAPAALRALLEETGLGVLTCEVTSRERRVPHFEVLTAVAERSPTETIGR